MTSWNETCLPTRLTKYKLKDIHNADEFGFFYQALPAMSLHCKGERCSIGKYSKMRLTGSVVSNTMGENIPMFVIGKFAKPRCFSGRKSFPCRYRAQKPSWMDVNLFTKWVKEVDRKFASQGRKIALIIDNSPTHPEVDGLKAFELISLPPNATSKKLFLDQGIISSLKVYYRHLLIRV